MAGCGEGAPTERGEFESLPELYPQSDEAEGLIGDDDVEEVISKLLIEDPKWLMSEVPIVILTPGMLAINLETSDAQAEYPAL